MLCAAVRGGPVLGAIVLVEQGRLDEATAQVPVERYAGKRRAAAASALLLQYARALGDQELRRSLMGELLGGEDLLAPTRGRDRPFMGGSAGELLDSAAALGEWEQVEEMLPIARRLVPASALLGPLADRAEARLRRQQGDRERAAGLMKDALAGFERLHVPFEAARTREELAELEPERAAELRAEALAIYERLGATPHADRVRGLLA